MDYVLGFLIFGFWFSVVFVLFLFLFLFLREKGISGVHYWGFSEIFNPRGPHEAENTLMQHEIANDKIGNIPLITPPRGDTRALVSIAASESSCLGIVTHIK